MSSEDYSYKNLPRRLVIKSENNDDTIVSCGVICFDQRGYCLLVQGRSSYSLSYLLYGAYRPVHISSILTNLTLEEVKNIKSIVSSKNLEEYYHYFETSLGRKAQDDYGFVRLLDLSEEIEAYNPKINHLEVPFGIPKGRPNKDEKLKTCAVREFIEETGINILEDQLSENNWKIEGPCLNGKRYIFYCWKTVIENVKLSDCRVFDTVEINERKWINVKHLPPSYNLNSIPKGEDVEGNLIEIDHDTIKIMSLVNG